jgi:subtilase family serine protease
MRLLVVAGLMVTGAATAACSAAAGPAAAALAGETDACRSQASCYSPGQIRVAYGIQPLTDHGIDGRGLTVVLPALAWQQLSPSTVSNIRQDLASFDTVFHLSAPRLQVSTHLTPAASRWLAGGEEMLDAEMIHAVAPAAAIHVILFNASAADTPDCSPDRDGAVRHHPR